MNDNSCNGLEQNYRQVVGEVARCCAAANRNPEEVRLVAVSKKHPAPKIQAMAALGQRDFGENYLQEALEKIQLLQNTSVGTTNLTWHFIGHIQSRKCREIAGNFSWVHTIESVKIARKLSQHRGELGNSEPLQALVQVNIDDEDSKSGVQPEQVSDLAAEILSLDHITLRGLMIIPRAESDPQKQHAVFQRCQALLSELQLQVQGPGNTSDHSSIDQLSMGMSGDMAAAIAEGATMVRIGTALFGDRPAN